MLAESTSPQQLSRLAWSALRLICGSQVQSAWAVDFQMRPHHVAEEQGPLAWCTGKFCVQEVRRHAGGSVSVHAHCWSKTHALLQFPGPTLPDWYRVGCLRFRLWDAATHSGADEATTGNAG